GVMPGSEFSPHGSLNFMLDLKGTAESPLLNMSFNIDSAAINKYRISELGGEIVYKDNQADIKVLMTPADKEKIVIEANGPLNLNLDTLGFTINPEDIINGNLKIENLSLSLLEILNLPGDLKGYIDGNVALAGTYESPAPEGFIKLRDASYKAEQYGINYETIKISVNFLEDKVQLDTLAVYSKNGFIKGAGRLNFESDFYEGKLSSSSVNLDFNKFNLFDHPQFNITLNGEANLEGDTNNLNYSGDLTIPEAAVYLPAVLSMFNKMYVPKIPKPLLVEELEKMSVTIDSTEAIRFEPIHTDSIESDYFGQLTGKIRIRIPKNMWIKNEDMRAELSGDLELIKNKQFFELFGNIDIVRGQYDLLGKTFIIKEGSVIFQGGEEITPRFNINALYTFRNQQRIEQTLSAVISGTPQSPEISFKLDENTVSEGDALSYILFGKSINELSIDEQENIEGSGNLAEKAAASILSAQISNFLGDRLNLDYLEVKSDGSFDNATISVGKYLTNDLFVSYEQRFGETDEINMAKYEVKLEYELFRFLFFVLNNSSRYSGFDVIVKFNAK
ncbi:MAG: translocation/assembly module TamB, partial [Prolixibacteraceae bacterium]|nr:translocation/assembly module TamB [Prolixibacteraceae bacterium]